MTSDNLTAPVRDGFRLSVLEGEALRGRLPDLAAFAMAGDQASLSRHPAWLEVFRRAMGHWPLALEAADSSGRTLGLLPLCLMDSVLFGRHLVSLPYLNTAGVIADDPQVARALVGRACELADRTHSRHLELRHEQSVGHPRLNGERTDKVHMRLALPDFPGPLWESFKPQVRNQIRKAEKAGLEVVWGGVELLGAFYAVFARNMRDLGTPVYSRRLFREVLTVFAGRAELCVVSKGTVPVAAGLLLHGRGVSEVPSASSLREHNIHCPNMLMYWHLLRRAIGRGQRVFDFGRSTAEGNTFRFKRQWGAGPSPAVWQYYRRGGVPASDLRPDNPKYGRMIRVWRKLPVSVTRVIGPPIVRGIP